MPNDLVLPQEPETDAARFNQPATAALRFSWGSASFAAEARITPVGLLAIGGMVGAILLAVVPIVREGGRARRH